MDKEQNSEGHQELDRNGYLSKESHSMGTKDHPEEEWGSHAAVHGMVSRGVEPEGPNMSKEEADSSSREPEGPNMSVGQVGTENAADAALAAALAHGREGGEIKTFLQMASRFSAMNKYSHGGSGSVATSSTGASSKDLLQSSLLLCSLDEMT